MILKKNSRSTSHSQRGFTLIELVIALAIASVITTAVTMTVYQVFTGNARSAARMTAVRQVENTGFWFSQDAQRIQEEPIRDNDPATPEFLTLTWTDIGGIEHQVVYHMEDMPGSTLKNLMRTHYIDGSGDAALVAQYINAEETSCALAGDVLVLTITADVSSGTYTESETREYRVQPRPNASE